MFGASLARGEPSVWDLPAMPLRFRSLSLLFLVVALPPARAETPLHERIDAMIAAGARGQPASATADDAEFLRRVFLDFAGRIPAVAEARAFLQDKTADKRLRLIDRLLESPDYPRRMQDVFHAMLMERLGDHPKWLDYLRSSFAANKPWDRMAREILRADPDDPASRGAGFFYAKRLEHYGENPVDYPGLTRDVGRLFLGKDFQCCQCHDHLFIKDYKQEHFQGLFAFFRNTYLHDGTAAVVGEKPTTEKVPFASVFKKIPKKTAPRLPGGREMDLPAMKPGEEFVKPPDAKTKSPGVLRHSPLVALAEQLPTAANEDFVRNSVNRFWFVLMGRGIVHPLDQFHGGNPPSHPELLDLLAREFVAHKFDIRWLLREIALSQTYQRSSLVPAGVDSTKAPADCFLTAVEKRLSPEQMLWSMLEATGEKEAALRDTKKLDALRARFVAAYANPPREPEEEVRPSLKAALFVLHDKQVQSWLTPRASNLIDRLGKLSDEQAAEELYLAILTRLPWGDERGAVVKHLRKHTADRNRALGNLAWALLASTEFGVNH
jgi:hypothetical protein